MANLIIKPTSGGSLILQDEGGDAALTVGATGTTTFAENATLSGTANNVGTVTAGTLASTVTYPAGHVVSFDNGLYTGTDIIKNDSNFTEATASLRVTITPTSPNKILLVCQGGIPHSNGTSVIRCSWGIVGGSMNLASSTQGIETWHDALKSGGHSYNWLYTPSSYGSAIIFTPTYTTTGAGAYFTEGGADQNITTYAMEIQQ